MKESTKKALTGGSELTNKLFKSNVFGLNFTPKTTCRQRLAERMSHAKRHLLHQTAYLTYWGGKYYE